MSIILWWVLFITNTFIQVGIEENVNKDTFIQVGIQENVNVDTVINHHAILQHIVKVLDTAYWI